MKKNIFLTGIMVLAIVLVLGGCPNSSNGPGSGNLTGEAFDEGLFREWAEALERRIVVNEVEVPFTETFINDALAFAHSNWERNTHKNTPATFNQLTRKFVESYTQARPVTIVKGGKTFNYANSLGSYMLAQSMT